jgi:hypothetical protein
MLDIELIENIMILAHILIENPDIMCIKGCSNDQNNNDYTTRMTKYRTHILINASRGFPHFLQASAGIVTTLSHGRFLPYPFQFIIHSSSQHSTKCILSYLQRY